MRASLETGWWEEDVEPICLATLQPARSEKIPGLERTRMPKFKKGMQMKECFGSEAKEGKVETREQPLRQEVGVFSKASSPRKTEHVTRPPAPIGACCGDRWALSPLAREDSIDKLPCDINAHINYQQRN
ncbi:hypothetical protein PWT90_01661 [Aphanocladium album]|nr:hypothetical protein PWT90_01661 [Aphanocladium album]